MNDEQAEMKWEPEQRSFRNGYKFWSHEYMFKMREWKNLRVEIILQKWKAHMFSLQIGRILFYRILEKFWW